MMHILKLFLPALFPSWRFFDVIGPSPRIEYALLSTRQSAPGPWQPFRPRPARLSFGSMLARIFWNPGWNESLFVATCAERLIQDPSDERFREILDRIRAELARSSTDREVAPFLKVRVVFVSRQGPGLREDVAFVSAVERVAGRGDA
jgi:hypothetical protein